MRSLHLFFLGVSVLSFAPLSAQTYVYHAFPDVCDGRILVTDADSVHWSNGDIGMELVAPPGTYSYTAYFDGVAIEAERVIESHGWEVQMMAQPYSGGLQLIGNVSIAYCGSSLWNHPCCSPDEVELHLLQDGEPYAIQDCWGCSGVGCDPGSFLIGELSFGHEYQLLIVDPTCAGTVIHPAGMAIAHSCANLEVITEVVDPTEGASDGTIHFVEAIPDPNEPYPISAPVIGTAILMDALTLEIIDLFIQVTSATWEGLAAGNYLLTFYADEGCQTYTDTLAVGTFSTGVIAGSGSIDLRLFPAVTDGILQVVSQAGGPVSIDIHDMHGRLVHSMVVHDRIELDHLPAGAYIATMEQGGRQLRARFIKH